MKYKKKPVVIDAEQFVVYQTDGHVVFKEILGVKWPVYKDEKGYFITIPTLEGNMRCNHLDWIIKGVQGEMYPCKPDVFEKTYERANL